MSEPPDHTGGGGQLQSNEDMLNDALNRLKNASSEILTAGAVMYPIFGIDEPTGGVYDTAVMLESVINNLEGVLNAGF
jgi:hypothetical protein